MSSNGNPLVFKAEMIDGKLHTNIQTNNMALACLAIKLIEIEIGKVILATQVKDDIKNQPLVKPSNGKNMIDFIRG